MVNVYEWLLADGTEIGLGTEVELRHWQSESIIAADVKLGKVLCQEPASEDEKRKLAWSREAA